jgi:hypothetical protein
MKSSKTFDEDSNKVVDSSLEKHVEFLRKTFISFPTGLGMHEIIGNIPASTLAKDTADRFTMMINSYYFFI